MKTQKNGFKSSENESYSGHEKQLSDQERTDKARNFRKDQIFRIVNNYQKSGQMTDMILSLDEIVQFWNENLPIADRKVLYANKNDIEELRRLLIALSEINAHNFNKSMYE